MSQSRVNWQKLAEKELRGRPIEDLDWKIGSDGAYQKDIDAFA